ncbi:hypothetical protein HID58_074956, partial [Brassica napus]
GDLLAHVLTAPKELSTKEEFKDYEEDWKKVGKGEYVNTRLGNGVVRKEKEKWKEVSGFVEVREESPKGHWKRKKNCQNSIEGKALQLQTGIIKTLSSCKIHRILPESCSTAGQWRGTYWSCREIPWRGLKTRIDVKVGETTIHSSPDETGSGQRSSSLEMQRLSL